LVDKDGICNHLPPPSEKSYYISHPTKELYHGCCTAFFFALGSHIPKTIWRKKLPLLKSFIGWLREPVQLMLSWEIGVKTGFDKSLGYQGKYLQDFLDAEKWTNYLNTYVGGDYVEIWESLFLFYEIFMVTAEYVAKVYHYNFPEKQGIMVYHHLKHIRNLSEDVASIYSE
jgi:aminoglycoside 6-adenylyltransferase